MKKKLFITTMTALSVCALVSGCGCAKKTDKKNTETKPKVEKEVETVATGNAVQVTSDAVSVTSEAVKPEAEEQKVETPTVVEENKAPSYTYTDMNATKYAKSSVNVRDLPCTDGNKVEHLSKNHEVTVTGQCNETKWYRIDLNGSVAYVSNNYLVDAPVAEDQKSESVSEASQQAAAPVDSETGDGTYSKPFISYNKWSLYTSSYYFLDKPEGASTSLDRGTVEYNGLHYRSIVALFVKSATLYSDPYGKNLLGNSSDLLGYTPLLNEYPILCLETGMVGMLETSIPNSIDVPSGGEHLHVRVPRDINEPGWYWFDPVGTYIQTYPY